MRAKWLWDIMPCELRLDDPPGTALLRCVHTHEPSDDTKRLIEAAPCLLEALESLQFADYGHCPQCGRKQCHDADCYVGKAIRQAKEGR